MTTITVTLPKKEKERLGKLALSYGIALPELSRKILQQIAAEVPLESLDDYENSRKLQSSIKKALFDWRSGNIRRAL